MSLLFNMLSRFFVTFLPRSKHILISWLQSLSAMILGVTWYCFVISCLLLVMFIFKNLPQLRYFWLLFLWVVQTFHFTYCIILGKTTITCFISQLMQYIFVEDILCLEPWQALSQIDTLWWMLAGRIKVLTLCTHHCDASPYPCLLYLSVLFLLHSWTTSETTHCCPGYPCPFFPQPFLLPHKVDDQMHYPKLCSLAGFFLTVLSLDHPWARLLYSKSPFTAVPTCELTHLWIISAFFFLLQLAWRTPLQS